jgi:hypothetical protein
LFKNSLIVGVGYFVICATTYAEAEKVVVVHQSKMEEKNSSHQAPGIPVQKLHYSFGGGGGGRGIIRKERSLLQRLIV